MSIYNSVFLFGRLTADPELRQTTKDTPVCRIRMATSEGKNFPTEFHAVTVYGKDAENIAKYFKKGDPILIWGHNHSSSYERNGKKVYSYEVVEDRFGFPINMKTEGKPTDTFTDIEDAGELPF